ncbi:MAG: sulfatase [Alphaproteobacteria bacterium]|nr:sulfatase [Alphaproteobacteria bacterium]
MNVARNLIQGTAGGLLGGALLGLSEAVFHLVTSGAPDLVAPLYATVLYGLVGLPLGFGAGLALTAYERVRYPLRRRAAARAFCLGGSFAVLPVLAYVLQYVVKKVVFLEQAVPASALAGIVLGVAILGVVLMTLGVRLVNGPLSFLLKGPGALGSWLLLVAVTAVAAVAGPGGGAGASTPLGKSVPAGLADAPNVLLIVVDTLRADALGTYGAEGDPTPALDAIAADGIVFEQAFSHASWTRASFASLFSSRLPTSHTASTKASSLPDEVELVSEVLQEGGVATIDLVNNINVTASFNFDQGWDLFLYEKPDFVFWGTESTFALTLYKVVHKLHERLIGSHEVTRFYQPAEVVLGHLLDFVHANSGARWFAVAHLMEPHDPYFPHPYLQGTGSAEVGGEHYGRAEHEAPALGDAAHMATLYADEVRHLDRKLADLVAALKAEDRYDDLMIVVTSDHGEEFAEHGGFWHGTTLYDEQIHVPLLVKLPEGRFAGTRVGWQARHVDVAPTIVTAMGLDAPGSWAGSDLITWVARDVAAADAKAERIATLQADIAALEALTQLEVSEGEEPPPEPTDLPEVPPEDPAAGAPTDEDLATLAELRAELDALTAPPGELAAHERLTQREAVAEQDLEGVVLSSLRVGGCKWIEANAGNKRGVPEQDLFDVVADPGEHTRLTEAGASGPCVGRQAELVERLREALDEAAEGGATRVEKGTMSDDEKCQLCALGYLTGPDCEGCR